MNIDEQNQQIVYYSRLLEKHFDGKLSLSERRELAQWLWRDRRNRLLYMKIKSGSSLKTYYDLWKKIDPEQEYELLAERCLGLQRKKVKLFVRLRWVAAVLVLVLGTAVWYKYGNVRKTSELEVLPCDEKVIAVLKTSSGEIFRLNGNNVRVRQEQVGGLQIRDSLKELVCGQIPLTDSSAMHELVIPRGGEYKLVLADGTMVWLNSESEIHFPAVFGATEREITLLGEAYLEVMPDAKRPFRVKAGEGIIEVLGTSFGLRIYPDEQQWSTVLVNGSVKVKYGPNSLLLEPGKEAFLKNGKLVKQECEPDKELAWVRGLFIFEHDRLEKVAKELSRWYNVEFRFENEKLKEYVFTGQVSRDIGVDSILDLMERMNVVKFEKTDDYVLIKEKAGNY